MTERFTCTECGSTFDDRGARWEQLQYFRTCPVCFGGGRLTKNAAIVHRIVATVVAAIGTLCVCVMIALARGVYEGGDLFGLVRALLLMCVPGLLVYPALVQKALGNRPYLGSFGTWVASIVLNLLWLLFAATEPYTSPRICSLELLRGSACCVR